MTATPQWAVLILACLPFFYYVLVLFSSWRFFRRCTDGDEDSREFTPPVSILKPVRGSDPDAYDNFASFCRQDYPEYEILFCVDSPEDEIVPVGAFAVDEGPRRDTSYEKLSRLKPVFDPEGTTTAGNAPGVNDGGGALVLASDEWAKRNTRAPLATIVAQAQVADDFAYLARTPAAAATKALEKAGLSADDIDLWEINEAFASVTLNSIRVLGIDEDKVNVNGGAVAIGHPIGASGARILGALVHELRRRGGGLGCAAICSGGGQGDAVILRVPPR